MQVLLFFFFNDTATTEIYTLSLHDALPISVVVAKSGGDFTTVQPAIDSITDASQAKRYLVYVAPGTYTGRVTMKSFVDLSRSEEHTSELQSRQYLVCRLLLEKKKRYYYRQD